MGLVGGAYRSTFFGRDVLKAQAETPAAMVIYNKKRYGIVTDRELIVLRESGDRLAYERAAHGKPWSEDGAERRAGRADPRRLSDLAQRRGSAGQWPLSY